jgi:hypothetical protein
VKHARAMFPLLFLLAAACHEKEEAKSPAEAQPIRVHLQAVAKGAIRQELEVSGETDALNVLRLASPVAGRITFLESRAGDRLAARAVAARVIPLESDAALRGFEVLRDTGGLDPHQAADSRRLQRELAARDVAIRVPFAAVVSERARNPGEQVAQGDVLLDVFDPRSLHIVAQVPAERSASIVGKPVEITGSGIQTRGKVEALMPAVAAQSLTVPVRVSIESPPPAPLLHAPVVCRITVALHEDAVLVPRIALLTPLAAGSAEVVIAKDGHAERRKISIGLETQTTVEAVDGISAGELLVVQGGYALPDGAPVEPAAEAPE